MAKRTVYFLRDSITGLYYTNASNTLYTWSNDGKTAKCDPKDSEHTFENAVIHTTLNSVTSGMKGRALRFKRDLEINDEDAKAHQWLKLTRDLARDRQHLKHFGIKIVTIEMNDEA